MDVCTIPKERMGAQVPREFSRAVQMDKEGLTAELVKKVAFYLYQTPTAKIKDVEIKRDRSIVELVPKPPTQILVGTGRSCVNPCFTCQVAETGSAENFCGECRSRPLVSTLSSRIASPCPGYELGTSAEYMNPSRTT